MSDKKLKIYGTDWCPDCYRAKRIIEKFDIAFDWYNTDRDPVSRQFVSSINSGTCCVPTIVFPDGSILVEPSNSNLEAKLKGIQEE